MLKVFVLTKAEPFRPELYVGVAKSKKKAEKYLREIYPHMRPIDKDGSYFADKSETMLLFIREHEVME